MVCDKPGKVRLFLFLCVILNNCVLVACSIIKTLTDAQVREETGRASFGKPRPPPEAAMRAALWSEEAMKRFADLRKMGKDQSQDMGPADASEMEANDWEDQALQPDAGKGGSPAVVVLHKKPKKKRDKTEHKYVDGPVALDLDKSDSPKRPKFKKSDQGRDRSDHTV